MLWDQLVWRWRSRLHSLSEYQPLPSRYTVYQQRHRESCPYNPWHGAGTKFTSIPSPTVRGALNRSHDLMPRRAEAGEVKSYRDVLEAYPVHPEPKSSAPDGSPCSRETVGLLARRPVQVLWVDYIGKESNRLEDVEHGMVHDLDDVLESYVDPNADPWSTVIVPILKKIPLAELKGATGLSGRHLIALRNGHARPSPATY